jgi:hypothetical protein
LTSASGGLVWTVSFTGAGVVNHSIADGVYDLTLNAADVTDAAKQHLAANRVDTFFRLFGDYNGDATVNSNDKTKFTSALTGGAAGYLACFDYNGDGVINKTDSAQFNLRYATRYSGFVKTL